MRGNNLRCLGQIHVCSTQSFAKLFVGVMIPVFYVLRVEIPDGLHPTFWESLKPAGGISVK